jgi:hypothetical protein
LEGDSEAWSCLTYKLISWWAIRRETFPSPNPNTSWKDERKLRTVGEQLVSGGPTYRFIECIHLLFLLWSNKLFYPATSEISRVWSFVSI